MSIQNRILLCLLLPALFVVVLITFLFVNLSGLNESMKVENARTDVLVELGKVQTISQTLTENVLRLTVHRSEGLSAEDIRTLNGIFTNAGTVKASLSGKLDNKTMEDVNAVFKIIEFVRPVVVDQLIPAINDKADDKILLSVNDLVDFALKDSQITIGSIIGNMQQEMDAQMAKMNADYSRLKVFTIIGGVLILMLFAITVAVIRFSVINKLKEFIATVKGFTSGDGDLTKRIPVQSKDELGTLALYFNQFTENVQKIIKEVNKTALDVAEQNKKLGLTLDSVSEKIHRQNEEINNLAIMLSSVTESSLAVVENIQNNSVVMQKASEHTDAGNQKLAETKDKIYAIKERTEKLSVTISSLSESANHIGEILRVINDIADQTNLLALNAAIEAARAGDAGRGFAVVADEVRKLAERTQNSVEEISKIIQQLNSSTSVATRDMSEAGTSVGAGVDVISSTAETFSDVVQGIATIEKLTSDVRETVDSQARDLQNVNRNMQRLAVDLEEGNNALADLAGTVAVLHERAETLSAMVGKFKA